MQLLAAGRRLLSTMVSTYLICSCLQNIFEVLWMEEDSFAQRIHANDFAEATGCSSKKRGVDGEASGSSAVVDETLSNVTNMYL